MKQVVAGRYEIVELLGMGGMAAVYRARHVELDSHVALKMLHPKYGANDELTARFRIEAQKAVQLRHPNIVAVHDLGQDEDGTPFMALELLEGRSLDSMVHGEPLPVEQAVEMIRQVLEGLVVAHQRGIVHRDLKPANLFLAENIDGSRTVKILDFGIAKVTSRGAVSSLTQTGHLLGTISFMSPEQLIDAKRVDHRADIYSLGATLFELLTCSSPAAGESHVQVLAKVVAGDIERHPRTLRTDIPTWLDQVVARALAEKPDDRFTSADEMRRALTPPGGARDTLLEQGTLETLVRGPGEDHPPTDTRLAPGDAPEAALPVVQATAAAPGVAPRSEPDLTHGASTERRKVRVALIAAPLSLIVAAGIILLIARPWRGHELTASPGVSKIPAVSKPDDAAVPAANSASRGNDSAATAVSLTPATATVPGAVKRVASRPRRRPRSRPRGQRKPDAAVSQRPTPKHKQDSPSGQAPKSTAKEPTPQDRRRLRYEAAVAGSRLLGPLQRCSRGKSEMVDMDLVIAGNGKPKKLTFASRGWTGTPAARCIEKLIRLKYRMKPFEQKTYAYRWELFIRQ